MRVWPRAVHRQGLAVHRCPRSFLAHALATFGLLVAVAACGPLASLGTEPLRTAPSPGPGQDVACMDALLQGTLAADPADPARVWVVGPTGERTDLTWPAGYRVRFTGRAEVVAPDGEVVARSGEPVAFGGGTITDTFEVCSFPDLP